VYGGPISIRVGGGPLPNVRFRRRSRSRTELVQAVHDEMGRARAEMRASVVDAVAIVEGRLRKDLDVRDQMADLVRRFEASRAEIDARDADLVRALDRFSDAYDLLARRIEEDRVERRALSEAIEHLATTLDAVASPRAVGPARDQVLGGTFDPTRGQDREVDLNEAERRDATVDDPERAVW